MKPIINQLKNITLLAGALILSLVMSCKDEYSALYTSEVTAAFTADNTEIFTGEPVAFTDSSIGEITHWSWIFEGATPELSTEQNPTITYSEAGTYKVTLVVSNTFHTNQLVMSEYITVTAAPMPVTADFSSDKVSILSGNSIKFTDNSTGSPTEWAWEFYDGSGTSLTSTEQNPEITFEVPGTYSVKLTAANSKYSGEEIKENYIEVIDASQVSADFSANKTMIYAGQQISFADISVGNATGWAWTFEGGLPSSSAEQNPTVTYNTYGKYKVTLIASNSVNSSTKEIEGYITVIPSTGLVAFLPFNSSAVDEGPNSLTITSGSTVAFSGTDRNNNNDATAVFDGNSVIKIEPSNNKQFVSSYSVGVWFKTDNADERWIWTEGRQDDIFAWFRLNNNTTTRIYSFNSQTSSGIINVTSDEDTPLSDGEWHYAVCVRDASAATSYLYIDGILVKSKTVTIQDLTNSYGFLIGGKNNAVDDIINLFIGQIDDLVIYDRALTQDEVTMLSTK